MRKAPETKAIPVMVLTSLPQCNEEKLLGEGATAYFEKSLLIVDKVPGLSSKPLSVCSPTRRRPKPPLCKLHPLWETHA
jgi:hypothetical protein